jgi:hypothetical protein
MKNIFTILALSATLLASAQKVVETYEDGKLVKREVYESDKPDKDFIKGLEISGITHLSDSEGFGYTTSIDWHTGDKDGWFFGVYYEAFASLDIDDYIEGGADSNFSGYGVNFGAMFNGGGARNLYGGFSLGRAPILVSRYYSIEKENAFAFGFTLKYRYKNITPQIKFIIVDGGEQSVAGFGVGYIF